MNVLFDIFVCLNKIIKFIFLQPFTVFAMSGRDDCRCLPMLLVPYYYYPHACQRGATSISVCLYLIHRLFDIFVRLNKIIKFIFLQPFTVFAMSGRDDCRCTKWVISLISHLPCSLIALRRHVAASSFDSFLSLSFSMSGLRCVDSN